MRDAINMSCPAEFETKTTVDPLGLLGAGGMTWFMSSFIAGAILKSFLPPKEWVDVGIFGAKFISALCLVWFVMAVGINISAVLRDWWEHRTKHLQIVHEYFAIYAGFTILIMGVLMVIFILLAKTGKINYSTIMDLAADSDPKDKMVQLKFMLENSFSRFALSLVTMCFLAPVIEEVFFRRFLFVALRKKMNFTPALLISVIFFMAVHPNVALGAIGGIYLGYVYEKGKSLPANILIHSIVNLTFITISMMLHDMP